MINKLSILLVNKFYYNRGGDCIYTIELEKLFRDRGHRVAVFSMKYQDNYASPYEKYFLDEVKFNSKNPYDLIKALVRIFGFGDVKKKFKNLIYDFRPDIIHVNNIHSYISPEIIEVGKKERIPIIWTLHDYKLLCSRYDFLRDGKPCELCLKDKRYAIKYKCMKNNIFMSLISYLESIYWNKDRIEKYVDLFICPSKFMAVKLIEAGFNEKKIAVLPNFINKKEDNLKLVKKENYYCFVGRISYEKGIERLLEAAIELPEFKLKIVGTGPLYDILKSRYSSNHIEFLGRINNQEAQKIISTAKFLVLFSEWYENCPISVIEALSFGTPVLTSNIGGLPEMIEDGFNGMFVNKLEKQEIKDKIKLMFSYNFNYGKIILSAKDKYSASTYYAQLLKLYERCINGMCNNYNI